MAFTVFADGAKGVIDFDWNGESASIVLHFEKSSPSVADYTALADQLGEQWDTELNPELSEDMTQGITTVYDLSEEFAPKYENSDESGQPGQIVGDSVPNNTAALVSHRTTATGRSGRGRTYIPGVVEGDESDGLLTAGFRTDLLAAWGAFITAVELTGWVFVVAQRFLAGEQLTTGVMRAVVTEILKLQLGTQRRRQVQSAT